MADRLPLLRVTAALAPGMDRLRADFAPVNLTAAEGDGAKQPTFTINAYSGDSMRPMSPWLPAPLVIDLQGARAVDGAVALLDHDPSQIVGQASSVKIGDNGVVIEGKVTGDVEDKDDPAAKVVGHAKRGFQWKASLDASIGRLEKVEAGERVRVNGRDFAGPVYIARACTIDGVSFVSIPADKSTSAAIAASEKELNMEFHAWLVARGFDPATLTEKQRDALLKDYQAATLAAGAAAGGSGSAGAAKAGAQSNGSGTTGQNGSTVQAGAGAAAADPELVFAQAKAKQARRAAITAECARLVELHPEKIDIIQAASQQANAEDWSAERFTLWAYRELPSNLINNQPRPSRGQRHEANVVEAAVARTMGIGGLDKAYAPQVLEASSRAFRNGLGLVELLMLAARANGHNDVSHRNPEGLLRAAFQSGGDAVRASGVSTYDVSGILSNVGNKAIVQNFDAVDPAWSSIAATRPVADFKQITSYSLTGDMQYSEVAPGGELKHATAGETSYTNQAKTYGRMFGIDRRDIINDDLGAFNSVMKRIGRGGALKLNDVFWTAFLNNSAFFTALRGNFDDGSDSELTSDASALKAAEVLFMNQTDPDGKPVGIMPKLLVVPPAYYRLALQLMNSSALITGASATMGSTNTFAGNFKVVTSPYMANSAYTGYSAKKWYLLADPQDMPVIEACFLNGVQRPTVESAQADFNQLGIQFRGYFDFGVALQEYRGGVAMKGEN
jgi:hypothetical protein